MTARTRPRGSPGVRIRTGGELVYGQPPSTTWLLPGIEIVSARGKHLEPVVDGREREKGGRKGSVARALLAGTFNTV